MFNADLHVDGVRRMDVRAPTVRGWMRWFERRRRAGAAEADVVATAVWRDAAGVVEATSIRSARIYFSICPTEGGLTVVCTELYTVRLWLSERWMKRTSESGF